VTLHVKPITIADARHFVQRHHSHLDAPVGALFAVAITEEERVVCVAVVSRPIGRRLQNGWTCEVTRCASDGTAPHAASMAYGAARRGAVALGWRRVVTSTILGESGTCLRAAGFVPVAVGPESGSRGWNSRAGREGSHVQPGRKVRWESGPDALPMDPEVDRLVRESVGKIDIPGRRERMPLFEARGDAQLRGRT